VDYKTVLVAAAVLVMFLIGLFVIEKLDKYLAGLRKNGDGSEKTRPDCVVLRGNIPDDELLDEVRKFKDSHKDAQILLRESGADQPEKPEKADKPD